MKKVDLSHFCKCRLKIAAGGGRKPRHRGYVYPTLCGVSNHLMSWLFGGCFLAFPGFFEAVALAVGFQDVNAVGQAVQ